MQVAVRARVQRWCEVQGEGHVNERAESVGILAGFPGLCRIVQLAREELGDNQVRPVDGESAAPCGPTRALANDVSSPVV